MTILNVLKQKNYVIKQFIATYYTKLIFKLLRNKKWALFRN